MLVNHELGMASANVLGNPDPIVPDAEHDLPHPVNVPAADRHNAAGIAGAMLHRVLAKLADRHKDRIPDDGHIVEMIDQRLQQPVGKLIDLSQLAQAGGPDDHIGGILDKRVLDPADVLLQAKGTKASARSLVLGLLDFNAAPGLPLALRPERKPHRKERVQADQSAGVQNHIIRALEVSIKLHGVAMVACPCPAWQSQLHGLHRMAAFGSTGRFDRRSTQQHASTRKRRK